MPYIKFDTPKHFADNRGSSEAFVNYLSKFDFIESLSKEFFFDHRSDSVADYEVVEKIDSYRKGLAKNDAKFYTGSINFSEKELEFIDNDPDKIRSFTIEVMKDYAFQFNKGLAIDDIVWFAKIERYRCYKGNHQEVKEGIAKQGEIKPGLNTHVHFLISRKSADNKFKISPKTNHRSTSTGPVKGGFDRDEFFQNCEKSFDRHFCYIRSVEETYHYNKALSKGDIEIMEKSIKSKSYDQSAVRKYYLLKPEEKHKRIEQIANYICFGNKERFVKKIDLTNILELEKRNNYSGSVYRCLVQLNQNIKLGKVPDEYNLTDLVVKNALKMSSRDQKTKHGEMTMPYNQLVNNPKSVGEIDLLSNALLDIDAINYESSKDDAEVEINRIRRKMRKRNI